MTSALTFKCVTGLVQLLRDQADLRADLDPGRLNLPGAWVTVSGIQAANLGHDLVVDVEVFLIVQDADYERSLEALAGLYNSMRQVLTPDGPVVPQGVVLPSSTTPLPALRVPVRLTESE